jgi:glycosyltransferase involved in cell wall biosynthesis
VSQSTTGGSRSKLLFLGHNLPHPPHEGALIRSYHTLRLLSEAFDVTAAHFFRCHAHPSEGDRESALAALAPYGSVAAFPIPQEFSRTRFVWDHLRSLFTGTPYVRWVHESRPFRDAVTSWMARSAFNLVHVDSLDLLAYLPDLPKVPVVLNHHNVESQLLRRRADHDGGLVGAYIRHQARLVEEAERTWCDRVDLNIAVSSGDASLLRALAPRAEFQVIPNGVDTTAFVPTKGTPSGGLAFVGGYSWFPNADAMRYFATEILPLIRARRPNTRLRWIGKIPRESAREFTSLGVEVMGYVDDIRPLMAEAECLVVPLRVGGGTRLKILDAWALGKAVVSTTVGSEGLEIRHGSNILLADTPESFAAETLRVLDDASLRDTLAQGGRETAIQVYDWQSLGRVLVGRYNALLDERRIETEAFA